MSDIVERLRRCANDCGLEDRLNLSECESVMNTAADVIVVLRGELESLRSIAGKAEVGQGFADIAPRYPAPRDGDPSMGD